MIEYLIDLRNHLDPKIKIQFKLDFVNRIQILKIMIKIEFLKLIPNNINKAKHWNWEHSIKMDKMEKI
jgi:hypothetical protein